MKKIIQGIFIIACMFTAKSYAASFDCSRATIQTEHAICENLDVNDADVRMATSYKIVNKLMPMGTRSAIRDEQIKWLAMRDRCGTGVPCLKEVYKMRQQQLDIYLQRVYKQGPF